MGDAATKRFKQSRTLPASDDLGRMLGEMLTETGGPPTRAERRAFRTTFGAPPRAAKPRKQSR